MQVVSILVPTSMFVHYLKDNILQKNIQINVNYE